MTEDIYKSKSMEQLELWLRTWSPYVKKCCLVYGPIGVGKTFTIHYVAENLGFKVIDAEDIEFDYEQLVIISRSPRTITGEKKLLWFDRPYRYLNGKKLRKIIHNTRVPIVLEDEDKKYYQYLGCAEIRVFPPPRAWIAKYLRKHSIVKPNYSAVSDDVRQSMLLALGSSGYETTDWVNVVKEFFTRGKGAEYFEKTHLPALLDTGLVAFYGKKFLEFMERLVVADIISDHPGFGKVLEGIRPQFRVKDVIMYYYEKRKESEKLEKE